MRLVFAVVKPSWKTAVTVTATRKMPASVRDLLAVGQPADEDVRGQGRRNRPHQAWEVTSPEKLSLSDGLGDLAGAVDPERLVTVVHASSLPHLPQSGSGAVEGSPSGTRGACAAWKGHLSDGRL